MGDNGYALKAFPRTRRTNWNQDSDWVKRSSLLCVSSGELVNFYLSERTQSDDHGKIWTDYERTETCSDGWRQIWDRHAADHANDSGGDADASYDPWETDWW